MSYYLTLRHWWAGWLLVLIELMGYSFATNAQTFERAVLCDAPAPLGVVGLGQYQVAIDRDGNTFAVGAFSGTATFGPFTLQTDTTSPSAPQADFYVAKLDTALRFLWVVQGSGQGTAYDANDLCHALALDSAGDVLIAGEFESYGLRIGGSLRYNASNSADLFVAKLNGATGACQWLTRAGGIYSEKIKCLTISPTGQIYVGGSLGIDTVSFGNSAFVYNTASSNAFVASITPATGIWQWATAVGGLGSRGSEITGIGVRPGGQLFVCGNRSPGIFQFGTYTLSDSGEPFVARMRAGTGAWLWAASYAQTLWYPDQNLANVNAMAVDEVGNCYLAGSFMGIDVSFGDTTLRSPGNPNVSNAYPRNAYVGKLDSLGAWQWVRQFGHNGLDSFYGLALDDSANIALVGAFDDHIITPARAFAVQVRSSDSAVGWSLATGRRASLPRAIAFGPNGRYTVCGTFGNIDDFGAITLVNPTPGRSTGFIAQINRRGVVTGTKAPVSASHAGLRVWPNPTTGAVWVSGPPPATPFTC